MLNSTRRLLEARAKHGIPTARRQWGAVLRRGYADDALGSGGHPSRQASVKRRISLNDENSAPDGAPRKFSFRKVTVPDDIRFKPLEDRSVMLGREGGTTVSKDVKPKKKEKTLKLDKEDGTTLSKDAKSKIEKNRAARPAAGKPKTPQHQPKTRWATRELANDASFGVLTTSRPLTTSIEELVKEIQPMPQDETSDSSEDTVSLVLLMTPGLARHALDSTVPKTVVERLQPSERFGKKYITTTAIVDRLPTNNDDIERAEGMAYMLFRNAPPAKDGDQVPFQGSAQKPGSLTFQMPRVSSSRRRPQAFVYNLQLPLSQTVFTTGLVSTMLLREYTRGGMDKPLELTSEQKLESQTLQLPALGHENSSHMIYAPLVPLTPFRKINYVMGNIIRKLSAQRTWESQPNEKGVSKLIETSSDTEQNVPASQDLEQAVSKYFEVLDLQPETVSVWALVIPKQSDSRKSKTQGAFHLDLHPLIAADETAISAAWDPKAEASKSMSILSSTTTRSTLYRGARLIKVLSGGGGWGKKAGLLSLDPDVQYSTRELRQDEGWQFDFDAPDDGTGAAIEAQKNQALGQIVKEGESIMFLLAPKQENLPLKYSELHRRGAQGLRTPSELELSFGAIPSSIDEIARSTESDDAPAVIQHYPNFFGMLSEGGMAFRFSPSDQESFLSKIDVPFSRYTFKQHTDPNGSKLPYYPNALIRGDLRLPPKSPAEKEAGANTHKKAGAGVQEETGADIHSLFRGMADDEERTTPL
jgi:hypothetical protein